TALRMRQRHIHLFGAPLVLDEPAIVTDVVRAQSQAEWPYDRDGQHHVRGQSLHHTRECLWRGCKVEDDVLRGVPVGQTAEDVLAGLDLLGRVLARPRSAPRPAVQAVARRWLQIRLSRHPKQRATNLSSFEGEVFISAGGEAVTPVRRPIPPLEP